jgi:glycosyltransferase involved in cell wall biosynthesis
MMPCYQVAGVVHLALASLLSQSYSNWECLIVDDGSTDELESAIQPFQDPRIRYFRVPNNRGRGHAHCLALEKALGELLCTLDADDWIYPNKLEKQVEFLNNQPEIAAVSSRLALVNQNHEMIGVFNKFSFGGAMVRTAKAREIGFDPDFQRSQDFDFLRRLLKNQTPVVLPDIGYTYYFEAGTTYQVVLEGLTYNRKTLRKTLLSRPLSSAFGILACWLKGIVYWALGQLGLWERFETLRRALPTDQERLEYQQARAQILGFRP